MPEGAAHPGLVLGVARFYHAPRASVRGLVDSEPRDGQLLGYLLVGMVIILSGKLVALTMSVAPGSEEFISRAVAEVASWLFVVPLVYIPLAGLCTLIARAFGGQGNWADGRAAFFWAVVVSAPLVAISAVLAQMLAGAPTWAAAAAGQIGPVFFVWALAQCFAEVFGFTRTWAVLVVMCLPILVLFVALKAGG